MATKIPCVVSIFANNETSLYTLRFIDGHSQTAQQSYQSANKK